MGQLITYAAGLDAVTIVWVAQRFTEEHRAALDWLNSQTSEDLNFFGLEIEVWRIGDSQPAPKFNIVSKPNDWTKTVRGRARESSSGELTTIQQLHLDFWTQFKEYLETHNASSHIGTPSKDHWRLFPIGRSYFALSATNGMKDGWSAFSLVMSGPDGEAHFQLIRDHHGEEIEQRFGPIKWEPLPGKGEKRITVMRDESPADPQKWPELNAWFMEHLERWGAFLRPIVKNLDASDWTQPPENLLSEAI
jgi:hypothetical protein